MKKLNLFSDLCSSVVGSRKDNGSTRLRVDYDSFTCRLRVWPLKLVSVLAILLTIGIGNAWGTRYTITFKTNSGDGTSASTSTACSTIVSGGSSYLSGNLATATKVYYSGGSGLKLGTSSNAGEIKMNLTASGQLTDPTVIVKAKRYNSGTNATISVNGATAINTKSDWDNYSFKISGKITYLQLNSSKYLWIESVIVTDECNSIDVTGGTTVILPAGSTTYNIGDWGTAGALHGYMAETSMPITSNDYCVAFTQAYEAGNANGLQCKASGAGIVQIAGITSTYGIDVEFQTGNSTTFNVSLTGAESKTAQSGTVSISTTSTTATLTITKSGSNAGYLKYIKITPKAAPSCSNTITLAHNSPSHGSVSFSNDGPIETCDEGVDVTMTITPASGYRLSAYDVGAGSVSTASGSGAITVPSNTTQNVTLKFAQNANGTYTANATFEAKPLNSISLSAASGEVYVGQYAQFAITYDPADILTKGTTLDGTPSYCVTTGTTNSTLKITGGKAGASITENKTEIITIKANADNTKKASVTITVKPLPFVNFEDIVHNKIDFTGQTDGKVTATIVANVFTPSQPVPTREDVTAPVGGNTCDTEHLHLVGWIYSEWSGVADYLSGVSEAPDTSEITAAKVGTAEGFPADTPCYVAVGSNINTSTWNGKTFYAVWSKEVTPAP